MKILVTGGAGFIGSHLCARLLDLGHSVTAVDNFNTYYNPAIKRDNVSGMLAEPRFQLVEGDILDQPMLQRLFYENGFEHVVHLAARAGVRPSIQEPQLYDQVNITGTINLLELARKHQIKKFIFASSSSVYGNNLNAPFSESDAVDHPISPYAATKRAGELICYTYHHLYGLSTTCLRFFTVYGPRQRPDMAIHKFARLIAGGQPVPVFGSGDSQRDYTYIDDILLGIEAAWTYCSGYHIYNLGESQTVTLRHLIHLLEEALEKKARLEFYPDQPGDVALTCADISRAQAELNYYPQTKIEQGIPRFAAWFKEKQKYLV
ncbi:NAD-dependent epimerase/dehydratase family protein [bacterium]|nr:NAD-dependent epimerase/dehydratase family protein [bacterium]